MNAFFSGTDLADETGTRYFGVLGKISNNNPEMVVRASSNCHSFDLKIEDVFSNLLKLNEDSDYSIPEEDYKNIKEIVYAPITPIGKSNAYTNAYSHNYIYEDDYYPSYTTPKKSTSTGKSPFTAIYSQLSALRYGKSFKKQTVQDFLSTAVDCAAEYLESTSAPVEDIYTIMQELDQEISHKFLSVVDNIDYDTSMTTQ